MQRGPLDSTFVLWVGEFGRMPILQEGTGCDHKPHGLTALLAGGGFKSGYIHGAIDDLGYHAVTDRTSVPDLMATILHQVGLDHTQLSFPNQGVAESLTEPRITNAQVCTTNRASREWIAANSSADFCFDHKNEKALTVMKRAARYRAARGIVQTQNRSFKRLPRDVVDRH